MREKLKMRNLDYYDLIVTDIDDTLIYGFWTDVMRVTWNIFRSPLLSKVLIYLQCRFNLYTINQKLVHMIKTSGTPVVVMTVRAQNDNTTKMLSKILERDFTLYELETDFGHLVKPRIIEEFLQDYPRIIFFDDNREIRENTAELEVDVVDPVAMREKLCQ